MLLRQAGFYRPGVAAVGAMPAWDSVGTTMELVSAISAGTAQTPVRPATIVAGDLMMAVAYLATADATAITLGMHASMSGDGWAELSSSPFSFPGGTTREAAIFWKISQASDASGQGTAIPGGITTTHNGSTTGDFFIARIYRFTAADGFKANPFEDIDSGTGSGTSVTMRDVTTGGINRRGVAFVLGTSNNSSFGSSAGEAGSNWAENEERVGAGSLNYAWQIQTCDLSGGGSVTGGTTTATASTDWRVVSFALAPTGG